MTKLILFAGSVFAVLAIALLAVLALLGLALLPVVAWRAHLRRKRLAALTPFERAFGRHE
jgi:Flp pilus assembly protein TadB